MSRTHGWQDVFIRVAHFSFLPARSWRAGVGPLFRCDRKGSNSGQSLCDPGRYLTAQSYGWLACGKVEPSAPPSKGPCETKRLCQRGLSPSRSPLPSLQLLASGCERSWGHRERMEDNQSLVPSKPTQLPRNGQKLVPLSFAAHSPVLSWPLLIVSTPQSCQLSQRWDLAWLITLFRWQKLRR